MTSNATPPNKPDHEINIIVNTRPKKVPGPTVTFEQIVALAFGEVPPAETAVVTVSYRHGNDQGTLAAGQTVAVRNGMIFDVVRTNRS